MKVVCNWLFGWLVVQFEKQSGDRAAIYGKIHDTD